MQLPSSSAADGPHLLLQDLYHQMLLQHQSAGSTTRTSPNCITQLLLAVAGCTQGAQAEAVQPVAGSVLGHYIGRGELPEHLLVSADHMLTQSALCYPDDLGPVTLRLMVRSEWQLHAVSRPLLSVLLQGAALIAAVNEYFRVKQGASAFKGLTSAQHSAALARVQAAAGADRTQVCCSCCQPVVMPVLSS